MIADELFTIQGSRRCAGWMDGAPSGYLECLHILKQDDRLGRRLVEQRWKSNSMNDYMVSIILPADLSEDFLSSIPQQRLHISRLLEKGVLTSYSLAFDRSRLWVTVHASSEDEVAEIIAGFPLSQWMDIEIQRLLFRERAVTPMPVVSMN
jgi:hypothetical protein